MKRTMFLMMVLLLHEVLFSQPWKVHGKLIITEDSHYLRYQDGSPFFWLGDTGWEMLHRLSREEIDTYLENRRIKGFNVIQTVIISEFIHMDKTTNFYGDSVLVSEDPVRPAVTPGVDHAVEPAYDFWDHVDYAVRTAEEKGLYLALVPTWGEWVIPRAGKALINTTAQAYHYGWFVGERFKNSPNIIWVLGGDRHPDERDIGVDLWRAMAEGLADGVNGEKNPNGSADYTTTLMTHHSYNSSSNWFHTDDWIDFHMWGSYHADVYNSRAYELALADWNLPDPKPTLNGEPCYEGHGINYALDDNGYFTSTDVRTAAYWSVFSGSMGFTYGAQPVWQFTDENRKKHSPKTLMNWCEGMDLPGATQAGYVRKLMESRPMYDLEPDQTLIISGQGNCSAYAPVIRGQSHIFVYIPTGNGITIKLGIISGKQIKAWWYDPRTGESRVIGEFENTGERSFDVPGMSAELDWLRTGRGCDWVLVIDDVSKNFPAPGKY
jgi:hypothetical protein